MHACQIGVPVLRARWKVVRAYHKGCKVGRGIHGRVGNNKTKPNQSELFFLPLFPFVFWFPGLNTLCFAGEKKRAGAELASGREKNKITAPCFACKAQRQADHSWCVKEVGALQHNECQGHAIQTLWRSHTCAWSRA